MNGYLLDTNVLAEFDKLRPDRVVLTWVRSADEHLLHLSVLTIGELRKGTAALPAGSRRRRLETWIEREFLLRFSGRILPVSQAIAERWGELAGTALRQGRPLPVIDGLLSATALHHNLIVATRNVDDFRWTGAQWYNPWTDTR